MAHVNCAAIYCVVPMRFVSVCNALGVLEQCFWSVGAMLLERWSNALRVQEQCFWSAEAMLWGCKSNALRVQE